MFVSGNKSPYIIIPFPAKCKSILQRRMEIGARGKVSGGDLMFTLFLRALILYVVMIVTMRGLGKRQLGQFQPCLLDTS